ncbi:MAG: hypothetical protein B7733_19865 [Myxococcales bacterium FL481]|nr:MAG: hypothetical protein B7733_19865 [Myxococcales bacterium FL481]
MLDLKAKLAAAGVVTKEQVREAENRERRKREANRNRQRSRNQGSGVVDVRDLQAANRGDAYLRIRSIVAKHRRDADGTLVPSADARPFGFVDASGKLRQLLLEPDVHQSVSEGKAAISAYMSNNGLAHCVLPRAIALDLAKVFPLWLRTLTGHAAAGKIDKGTSSRGDRSSGAAVREPATAPAPEPGSAKPGHD